MTKRSILVVDDEPCIRLAFAKMFTTARYEVQTAESAEQALQIMVTTPAAVLFLDLNLPAMNGLDLCREVRKGWPWSIAIAVTGYASLFELVECREAGFEDYYPAEISGGMQKRAGLARAMALDPEILFFDEPSAGLDPVSARLLDDLIINLRDTLGTTIVVVTHELASIFAIGNNSVFLDTDSKTMLATGDPKQLLAESADPKIIQFLTRGEGNADTHPPKEAKP